MGFRSRRSLLAYAAVLLGGWLLALSARAQPVVQAGGSGGVETYEWERTRKVLERQGLVVAENAAVENKPIAWIRIVRNDIFVPDELVPLWLNKFHSRTREFVVRRELLFHEGGPYHDARIEETMRNLRNMGIFALVRIVPIQVEDPNKVGVLVYTRDIWSLRLEQAFNITTQINQLSLQLTEVNLFGANKQVGLDFEMFPKTYFFLPSFYARRVLNSRVGLNAGAGPILNRAHNQVEGSLWRLRVGEPFYYLNQHFSYQLNGAYTDQVVRRVRDGDVQKYQPDGKGTPFANAVFRQKTPSVNLWGYYRRGDAYKQTFGVGWDYREIHASPTHESDVPAALRDGFERTVLPMQRREIGPALEYAIFVPKFATFNNLSTFGKSENVQVGPTADVLVRAPLAAFGSNVSSWVLSGDFGYVVAPGGGLLQLKVGGRTRYQQGELYDQLATAVLRGATPILGWVRLVGRAYVEARRRDTARTYVTLGSDMALRGFPSQYLWGYGASRWLANFEARTLPWKFHAFYLGGVAFFDVGSVFYKWSEAHPYYAAGLGIRFLFSKLSRYPFSVDGGTSPQYGYNPVPAFNSHQTVPMTEYEDTLIGF
ncbi:MAG: POTRA domain-containing protein [Myxococcales bacterium]